MSTKCYQREAIICYDVIKECYLRDELTLHKSILEQMGLLA